MHRDFLFGKKKGSDVNCLAPHSCCPVCRSRDGYHLGDGRRKCCRCGKKYSRRHLKSRLPAKILKQMALYFWLATPITAVAADLNLDRKTVRRHYALMQQGISADVQVCCRLADGDTVGEFICLFIDDDSTWCERVSNSTRRRIHVTGKDFCWSTSFVISLPAVQQEIRCLVYEVDGQGHDDKENCQFDLLKFERIVQGLCCRKKAPSDDARQLMISEVIYRFNQRHNPGVTADLYRFLRF